MSLDTFIQEIEERKTRKINLLDTTLTEKKMRIQHSMENAIKEMRQKFIDRDCNRPNDDEYDDVAILTLLIALEENSESHLRGFSIALQKSDQSPWSHFCFLLRFLQ